ncbi:hypothetical protein A2W13_01100 [Candidatus Woesebacteria bacterium RBG_16_36_11]|uniref:DUF5673 domain-containing protein n=3 Tax=Candidatus Woeseibacteriota TaxID=1752722 RepID=A0A1F7XD25_9BACT|nr:MAG: hypothetical protein A2Z67_03105 [Candidatus Woesebacteria bacterium RBG_13_36_22]OGM12225.1 MAG: hypothetical protein A2W13_01100 [Candidatus Woesebacteria bacterium RBG_16_36_11]OGM16176.1 MAG: hypothetical protein A2V55_01420 [Candidatus Woesebacteria bacterium RBG_19FT_COMBO_37_29]
MPALIEETKPKEEEKENQEIVQEKDLFVWSSPARPFKRRDREFYITICAIAGIVGLILFLTEGLMPVILIISLIFLFYVLSTVEPDVIEYKIINKGIKIADAKVDWNLLTRFWFSRRYDSELLIIEEKILPGRVELVIKGEDKEKLREVLKKYVIEEETPLSFLDKSANWFSRKLPGNK